MYTLPNSTPKNICQHPRIQAYLIIPFSLLLVQLLGHYGLFLGHTFLVEEDLVASWLSYLSENTKTMGWRPDIGQGIAFFYADPGVQHVWSLLRWWFSLFTDQILASTITIFLTLWFISIAHYLLLKKAFPDLNPLILVFLASLISFGSLRHEFLFNMGWSFTSISVPIVAIIIFNYLEQPSFRQYFQYSLVLFFTLFLGSTMAILNTLIFSVLFFISYALYHWKTLEVRIIWNKFTRFLALHFFSGITVAFLGAWIFYSIFIEHQISEPIRDQNHLQGNFFTSPDLTLVFFRIFSLCHAGLISAWSAVLGIQQFSPHLNWNFVVPIFPVILFFFLFLKSQNFWEFSAKFLIIFGFVYHEIVYWIPGVLDFLHSILNLYPPGKFYQFIQTFQILMIGMFVKHVGVDQKKLASEKNNWIRVLAIILSFLYGALLLFAIIIQVKPQFLIQNTSAISPLLLSLGVSSNSTPIILNLVLENIRLLNETINIQHILFYITTFGLVILFTTRQWVNVARWKGGFFFPAVLLLCNIFFSWSIFPLNKEQLIWNQQVISASNPPLNLKDTDRTVWVGAPNCRKSVDYFICIQNKFLGTSGPRRKIIGYRASPVLDFSRVKSHTPKDQILFAKAILRRENISLTEMRYFSTQPNLSKSKIYDLSAVNYLLSSDSLPKSEHLEPIHTNKQFFLYQNKQAWPYFYLADQIQSFGGYGDLYDAQKGAAYLKEESAPLASFPHKRELKLVEFNYGDLKFQYSSRENEFLAIIDAWHPLWRARINNIETKVFKTNGIFKGVALPPGEGSVHLFFDHSKYLPGIWVSLFAWAIFIFGWLKTQRKF